MPKFELARPGTLDEALDLLADTSVQSLVVAGGTDLLPNLKHELFTPERVVSLAAIAELRGLRELDGGWLGIGAMTRLDEVAADARLATRAPALAQACSLVAGPQLRTMGTLGGNVLLDTRCQWYNQTYFWRAALGFCLKKDGTLCHVVEGGSKCVAAAATHAPTLMTLGAMLEIEAQAAELPRSTSSGSPTGSGSSSRERSSSRGIPPTPAGHRGAYGKPRSRLDRLQHGVAARIDLAAAALTSTRISS
jgi:4-hydroxybenzoyl-CoA reductase subunit beta